MTGPFDASRWVLQDVYHEPSSGPRHKKDSPITRPSRAPESPYGELPSISTTQAIWPAICGIVLAVVVCSGVFFSFMPAPPPPPSNEIPPHIKAYVDRALSRALRDPVGRRDFALLADGGRVVPALTGFMSDQGFTTSHATDDNSPNITLVDDLRIGQCWSIPAGQGQLGFRLSEMIFPTHITIDHIPIEIAADASRIPRTLILWGAVDGLSNESRLEAFSRIHTEIFPGLSSRAGPPEPCGFTYVPLAMFDYDIRHPSHIQTYTIDPYVAELGLYFGVMVLEVASNWGGETTCLYRVRVHGEVKS